MRPLRLAASFGVALVASSSVIACLQDFDKFEANEGTGALDGSADAPRSSTGDGAAPQPGSDAGKLDASAPDACTTVTNCVATKDSCRGGCDQTRTTCRNNCGGSQQCRRDCDDARDTCYGGCRTTCQSCATVCPQACN